MTGDRGTNTRCSAASGHRGNGEEKPYLEKVKEKANTTQNQVSPSRHKDKLGLERSVRGWEVALERRLEARSRQTMFPALAYYWVFWAAQAQKGPDLTLTDERWWGQSLTGDSCPRCPHNLFNHMHARALVPVLVLLCICFNACPGMLG